MIEKPSGLALILRSYCGEQNFRRLIFSNFKFSIGFNFRIVITCRK